MSMFVVLALAAAAPSNRAETPRTQALLAAAVRLERAPLPLATADGVRDALHRRILRQLLREAIPRALAEAQPGTPPGLGSEAARRLAALPLPSPALPPTPAAGQIEPYRLPVPGRIAVGAGELTADGFRARGITLATVPGATVVAPAAGRVAYAGSFRAWRGIVILDHGHGWTTLIAGLDKIGVAVDAEVAAATPLGRAGPAMTIQLRHRGRPVDVLAMAGA